MPDRTTCLERLLNAESNDDLRSASYWRQKLQEAEERDQLASMLIGSKPPMRGLAAVRAIERGAGASTNNRHARRARDAR